MEEHEDIRLTNAPLWATPAFRNPLLFSVGIHLGIALIVFMPTSFFHRSETPEIYSVELVDLSEPWPEPKPMQPPPVKPLVKQEQPKEPVVSTKPILSTRNIPQAPTEIKILRARKVKIDLRKDQPPIDQTMIFAALERMRQQEQMQAHEELERAEEKVKKANDEALQALRTSILSRQADPTDSNSLPVTTSQNSSTGRRQQAGQRANSIMTQYIATMGQHIGEYWRLPEGQKWDNSLSTTVIVKIKADGIVLSAKIDAPSKSRQFDRFVIETIDKASPLPPVPAELPNIPLKLHFYPQGLQ